MKSDYCLWKIWRDLKMFLNMTILLFYHETQRRREFVIEIILDERNSQQENPVFRSRNNFQLQCFELWRGINKMNKMNTMINYKYFQQSTKHLSSSLIFSSFPFIDKRTTHDASLLMSTGITRIVINTFHI